MLWKVTIHYGTYKAVEYANGDEDHPEEAEAKVRARLHRQDFICLPMASESTKIEPAK